MIQTTSNIYLFQSKSGTSLCSLRLETHPPSTWRLSTLVTLVYCFQTEENRTGRMLVLEEGVMLWLPIEVVTLLTESLVVPLMGDVGGREPHSSLRSICQFENRERLRPDEQQTTPKSGAKLRLAQLIRSWGTEKLWENDWLGLTSIDLSKIDGDGDLSYFWLSRWWLCWRGQVSAGKLNISRDFDQQFHSKTAPGSKVEFSTKLFAIAENLTYRVRD